jgi:septal ring factor EnvC (AmiA/AmiB activator)
VAQHSGRLTDGNIEVFIDVGLGEVIGMSAAELRQLIASVNDLRKDKESLHDLHEELKKKVQKLEDCLQRNDEKLDKLQDIEENLEHVMSKFEAVENEDVEEADEEEPGIALEDQLRITEQSAKAIDILSSHQLSTVWQTCSKNTFGEDLFCF